MTQTEGIYGGRFSGAGFKGCCMSLINPEFEEAIIEKVKNTNNRKSTSTTSTPCFPYPSGPREYQIAAFENWKSNKQNSKWS